MSARLMFSLTCQIPPPLTFKHFRNREAHALERQDEAVEIRQGQQIRAHLAYVCTLDDGCSLVLLFEIWKP